MTGLTDEERLALRRAALSAQAKLDEAKAAEARGEAPVPFAAALGQSAPPPPSEPLPTRPWWCGNCGETAPWRPKPYCDECSELDRRKRLAARFEVVRQALPPSTEGARLGSVWLVHLAGPEAQAKALKYVNELGWLTLEGPSRAGKTSLAAAVFRSLIDRGARERASEAEVSRALGMKFVPARMLRKAQQEHALGKGEAPLLVEARRASVLVLDDLGNEGPDRGQAVGDVLFDRHEERLPTIVTTGLSREEIETRYGSGLKNRLFEGVTIQLGAGGK